MEEAMCDPSNPFQEVIDRFGENCDLVNLPVDHASMQHTSIQILTGLETVRDICEIDAMSTRSKELHDIYVERRAGHVDLLANTLKPEIREQVHTIVCNVERNVGKEVIPADVRKVLEEV